MAVDFRPRDLDSLPIEAAGLLPEKFVSATLQQLRSTSLFVGNRTCPLGQLFEIQGDPGDGVWTFTDSIPSVQHLGEGMSSGRLVVLGSAGRHVGSRMSGGEIEVGGDAGDWVGAEMSGGSIVIRGSSGDHTGGSYRGSPRGMTGGRILVFGSAGNEVGRRMRRGLIAVQGDVGDLAGASMQAGTILTLGTFGARAGAGMIRGSLVACGPLRAELVPTFRHAARFQPPFVPPLWKELQQAGFQVPSPMPSKFELWNGDLLEGGRGELLIASECKQVQTD